MAVEKFDLTSLQEATVAGDNTMLLINTEPLPSLGRQPRKITKANLLTGVGGGGGVSLPADAPGALVNDGAGNLSWSPDQDLIWENAAGVIQPNGVGANINAIKFYPGGGIWSGKTATSLSAPNNVRGLVITRDATAGEAPLLQLDFVAAQDTNFANASVIYAILDAQDADNIGTQILLESLTGSGDYQDLLLRSRAGINSAAASISIDVNGNIVHSVYPTVADGASAVAYLFDTSNALVNATAFHTIFRNGSVDVLKVGTKGGLLIGNPLFGDANYTFESGRDWDNGEYGGFYLDVTSTVAGNLHSFNMYSDHTFGNELAFGTFDLARDPVWKFSLFTDATQGTFDLVRTAAFTPVFAFRPGDADGPGTVAYFFDTTTALADAAARLLKISNNAVEKLSVDPTGALFIQSTKVLGARVVDARIDDAINSGDATTDGVIDAIRDALITHGLIAAV